MSQTQREKRISERTAGCGENVNAVVATVFKKRRPAVELNGGGRNKSSIRREKAAFFLRC